MTILSASKLSMETVIVQGQGNIISDMNGETVMMSVKNGKYYNLGTVGGEIWRNIKEPISVNKLISKITNEFDVEKNHCQKDVFSFLTQLLDEKLIVIL